MRACDAYSRSLLTEQFPEFSNNFIFASRETSLGKASGLRFRTITMVISFTTMEIWSILDVSGLRAFWWSQGNSRFFPPILPENQPISCSADFPVCKSSRITSCSFVLFYRLIGNFQVKRGIYEGLRYPTGSCPSCAFRSLTHFFSFYPPCAETTTSKNNWESAHVGKYVSHRDARRLYLRRIFQFKVCKKIVTTKGKLRSEEGEKHWSAQFCM